MTFDTLHLDALHDLLPDRLFLCSINYPDLGANHGVDRPVIRRLQLGSRVMCQIKLREEGVSDNEIIGFASCQHGNLRDRLDKGYDLIPMPATKKEQTGHGVCEFGK